MLTFEGESVRSETDCAPSFIVSADFCKMYLQLIDCAPRARAAAYSRAAWPFYSSRSGLTFRTGEKGGRVRAGPGRQVSFHFIMLLFSRANRNWDDVRPGTEKAMAFVPQHFVRSKERWRPNNVVFSSTSTKLVPYVDAARLNYCWIISIILLVANHLF